MLEGRISRAREVSTSGKIVATLSAVISTGAVTVIVALILEMLLSFNVVSNYSFPSEKRNAGGGHVSQRRYVSADWVHSTIDELLSFLDLQYVFFFN
jgi:hypothetical protein